MGKKMKKILGIICMVLMVGCGFRPMFSGVDTDIYVAPIRGINGIELRNALNVQFGGVHDENAKYKLIVELDEPITRYKAIEQTGDATWQQVVLNARYKLTRGDETIASGHDSASESYTFVRYLVAANASYNNAVQNTIVVLSQKIGARVIAETQHDMNAGNAK